MSEALLQRVGHMDFRHRHFLLRLAALIDEPGGMHGEKPADVNVARRIAEHELHRLALGELRPEGLPLSDVALRLLQAPLGKPEPAHAMGEPRRPQVGSA